MTYTVAPAASSALGQANKLWPNRSKASDGLAGDAAHNTRKSWHGPCNREGYYRADGVVMAFDLTHDPANGCDAHRLVRAAVARRDPRILEAISNSQIWTRARDAEGWRPYSGANPHVKHAHVSIVWLEQDNTAPWWTTPPPVKEDDMTAAQEAKLDRLIDLLEAFVAPRRADKVDVDPGKISAGDILTKIENET